MAFAQLTHRESLRDLESCLRAVSGKLYHLGLRGDVLRSTLARANERRDWRVYADLAQVLISIARPLYANEPFGVELDDTVYALDSTTIDVCLSLCPWAPFERSRGAVKMHTLLDLRGSIPTFIDITHGRSHDVFALDRITFEAGAFYVMDRGYLSFKRLKEAADPALVALVLRAAHDLGLLNVKGCLRGELAAITLSDDVLRCLGSQFVGLVQPESAPGASIERGARLGPEPARGLQRSQSTPAMVSRRRTE
jgi:hypothetical protein